MAGEAHRTLAPHFFLVQVSETLCIVVPPIMVRIPWLRFFFFFTAQVFLAGHDRELKTVATTLGWRILERATWGK